jgi:hypothetical protein
MGQLALRSAVATGLLGALVAISPPAAQAASTAVTIGCASPNLTLSSNNFGAAPTDTIVVTNSSGGVLNVGSLNGVTSSAIGNFDNGTQRIFTIVSASGGSINFTQPTAPCANNTIVLTFVAGGGGSSSDTLDSTPPPVLQQFGKPTTDTCDAAATEMLNIGGAESGGWSESWAEWMNGGLGGAVCTRMLVYSNALGHWVVG